MQRYIGPRTRNPTDTHAIWELTFTFSGRGEMSGEATHPMEPNQAILIPPGVAHSETASQPVDTLWVGLFGSALRDWPADAARRVVDPSLTPLFERLWGLTRQPGRRPGPLLDALLRQALARFQPEADGEQPTEWADRVLHYLHRRLEQPLTVPDIAAAMDCSEGHLHRRFKRAFGVTPLQLLTQLRIERARDLLEHTSLSVKQVALRTGFRDPLYFSRVFRRTVGSPPSEARRPA